MHIGNRRVLLRGPVLIGFQELFDDARGDSHTPRPYLTVKPALVGGALLAYPCPHCDAVRPEMVHPQRRFNYRDETRGFSWCPACRKRYILDDKGAPLSTELGVGATYAPAIIERDGKVVLIEKPVDGLNTLGAC